jgi:NAD(P)-dependent dehydrogenase (short-subunit alcohol dehydrogenase family)
LIIPNRFAGKVCIVTGAESGIGNATATRFAEEGAQVIGIGLDDEQGLAWQNQQQAKNNKVSFFKVDVSKNQEVKDVIERIAQLHKKIDVLVNNAGIFDYHKVEDLAEGDWDRVMAVNVKSVYLTSKYCIPHMRPHGGSIINIASVHAIATMDSVPVYAASKGAVVSLSRQMAIDYIQDGIRVNSVVVGGVKTAMSLKHATSIGKSLDDLGFVDDPRILGRTANPDEIAAGITYLASSDASFVVGSAFLIDGGLLADI